MVEIMRLRIILKTFTCVFALVGLQSLIPSNKTWHKVYTKHPSQRWEGCGWTRWGWGRGSRSGLFRFQDPSDEIWRIPRGKSGAIWFQIRNKNPPINPFNNRTVWIQSVNAEISWWFLDNKVPFLRILMILSFHFLIGARGRFRHKKKTHPMWNSDLCEKFEPCGSVTDNMRRD